MNAPALSDVRAGVVAVLLALVMLVGGVGMGSATTFMPAASAAETIGGSTGGTGEGTGSGTIGSGVVPGTGTPNWGSLQDPSALGNVPWFDYYDPNPGNCGADAVGQKIRYNRAWNGGNYKDTFVRTTCLYPASYEIRAYKTTCVSKAYIKVEQMRPVGRIIENSSASTAWGKGDKSIKGCEASQKLDYAVERKVGDPGQYKSAGWTDVYIMYVRHYTGRDSSGRIPADAYHSHKFAKKVNTFTNYLTITCDAVYKKLVAFDSDCTTPPPKVPLSPGDTPDTGNLYQCVVPGKGAIDGVSTDLVDIMRDGSKHKLTWGTPKVVGKNVTDIKPKSTEFRVWNAPGIDGVGFEGNAFELWVANKHVTKARFTPNKNGMGTTAKVSGIHTEADLRVFRSTVRDKRLVAEVVWTWDATIRTPVLNIDSIDVVTGEYKTSTTWTTRKGEVQCSSGSPAIAAMKVLNDTF